MKKAILTTVIISALLIGCTENKTTTQQGLVETEMAQEHDTEPTHEKMGISLNNSWVKEIKLDNGNKWMANLETTQGVNEMLGLLKDNNPRTVEEYHQLASKLEDTKNVLVKECTMEGPSHDNLHIFLNPLIGKIDELGKVTTMEKGNEIIASIQENLNEYNNYFK